MSRRDTIIIAVLINAGLLIVLFATALKSDDPTPQLAMEPAPVTELAELTLPAKESATPGDEVDQVLRQYAQAQAQIQTSPTTDIKPASFADDLNALGTSTPAPVIAVAPTPAPAPVQESGVVEVKVRKGDVLEKLARSHRTTVAEIMKVNRLTTTNLKIGQVLKIPSKGALSNTPAASHDGETKYYTVKNGDNPWTIAVKNHMKVDDLLKLNNLDQEKARRLKPGDQLRIQ